MHPSFVVMVVSPFSHVRLFVTPWIIACQIFLSIGFSQQEYWSGLPCPPPGDLPNPGIEPTSPALQVASLPAEPQGKPGCYTFLKILLKKNKNKQVKVMAASNSLLVSMYALCICETCLLCVWAVSPSICGGQVNKANVAFTPVIKGAGK